MSSIIKFITNTKGSGDWCVVEFDGEIIHQGHDVSFSKMFDLFVWYGGSADIQQYLEMTDEELENYLGDLRDR